MKVVINDRYGGFGLSDAAYEWLISKGVKVGRYYEQPYNPETKRYERVPENEGEVIYDRTITPEDEKSSIDRLSFLGRYWDTWISEKRDWPLLVECVETLGEKANGLCATLKVVEMPDGTEYIIEEYDGNEWIAEKHRTWN